MKTSTHPPFWREAFALRGSVTPRVLPLVFVFGLIAGLACLISSLIEKSLQVGLAWEVAPFEFAGAALAVLLVLRTNAGYDRWWEARRLWGGIVNQSRNLAISAMAYGPQAPAWRHEMIGWASAFPHVARSSLRGDPVPAEVASLVGEVSAAQISQAGHKPSFVALQLAALLQQARSQFDMDGFAFQQIDRERAALIDHVGACERILKTPLPTVYSIKIRRFIALFLLTLPFALLHQVSSYWLVPLVTMMVPYPLLALDQIGIELENPFATQNLSHLPLDDISATIQQNLQGALEAVRRLETQRDAEATSRW
jgi:putative membrane protein